MSPSQRVRTESGFTLVELLVAAFVLVVGLLGALALLTNAVRTTAANNERVGATNLARELVEGARSVEYNDLTSADMTAALQALPGMGSGSPWVIVRRNVRYTVTPTACVFDDPIDRVEAGRTDLCPGNPTGTGGDRNGDDFRRVTFRIAWVDRGRTRTVTQTGLIVNPTGGLGPRITSFEANVDPVTSGDTASFTVTTQSAATVNWAMDDGSSAGLATGGTTTWGITWSLGTLGSPGSVVDGTYRMIAQAYDSRGIPGDSKIESVVINRTAPFALASLDGGHNTRLNVVELSWAPTIERDILGYRVYYAGPDKTPNTADDVLVCPAGGGMLPVTRLSCADEAPTGGASYYFVVAIDKAPNGSIREGSPTILVVAPGGARPDPAGTLSVTTDADGFAHLTWTASPSSPLELYRVYRGGTGLNDRVGVSAAATLEFTDTTATAGAQYWVTAVDDTYNESDPVGPVTWTP